MRPAIHYTSTCFTSSLKTLLLLTPDAFTLFRYTALRAMNNKLREDANNLGDAVDDLSDEIDLLEPEAER